MVRIIAGSAGSLALDVPAAGTRPTSDRVRESLFGALESADALRGARVVDLYAGSGALGLEALSRGARSVDLVERDGRAAGILRRNAERVAAAAPAGEVHVHRAAVAGFLASARGPYDLALIDPPYELGDDELTAALTALVPALAPGALVVLERASRTPGPAAVVGLEVVRERRYGDTLLRWFRPQDAVSA